MINFLTENRLFISILILLCISCGGSSITDANYEKQGLISIYQHDYYPDSILLTQSIKWDIVNESADRYSLRFSKDSCEFIGYHESWWLKIQRTGLNRFITRSSMPDDYFEIEFTSSHQLRVRNVLIKQKDTVKGAYKTYHKVNKVLTQTDLQKRLAKDLFAGKYRVLYKDTVACDTMVTLDSDFNLVGVDHFKGYGIETEIDWDFGLENACWLTQKVNSKRVYFSFKFSGDSLTFYNYAIVDTPDGSVPEITSPFLVLRRSNK
ncbi:MAG: hypothetical protein ACK5DD_06550 [Cyclobacteriaceae bacterium]|jgi:hypothetical protein